MMPSREVVARTIRFQYPDRLPYDFSEKYGSDFFWIGMDPSPDARPTNGVDEWGAVWENIGVSQLGQVKDFPLKDWNDIRAYCRQMANLLGRLPAGGFIPRWYTDPAGAGHRPEAIDVMCEEFLRISRERYGNA